MLARFGETGADLMQWAPTTGDPLADAVVDETHELGMGQYEMIAAAAGRGDLSTLAMLTDDGAGMVDDLVSACRAVANA